MGNDTPLAVLSEKPAAALQLLQAALRPGHQPAHRRDPRGAGHGARDRCSGRERNLLEPSPPNTAASSSSPIPDPHQRGPGADLADGSPEAGASSSVTLPTLFPVGRGRRRAAQAPSSDCAGAGLRRPSRQGHNLLDPLRPRAATREHAPIPALLAVAAVHHHLIREGIRHARGPRLETGEPREVHHFALLLGYGASADQPLPGLRDHRRHAARDGVLTRRRPGRP